jgi:hypothetical protein
METLCKKWLCRVHWTYDLQILTAEFSADLGSGLRWETGPSFACDK